MANWFHLLMVFSVQWASGLGRNIHDHLCIVQCLVSELKN